MPLLEVGSRGCLSSSILWRGGGTGDCLFSSFILFRARYVRYLMAFWWK